MFEALRISLIMPALNEETAIGGALSDLPPWIDQIIVVDNGSSDRTAAIARDHGAVVVVERRRGYGAACLAGLRTLAHVDRPPTDAVVFMDADRSDDPADLPRLLAPLASGQADLVIGSRVQGKAQRGALTLPQRWGNALACSLIRRIWRVPCTDLGPFRAVRFAVMRQLQMSDLGYGWTVQMQARAARLGVRMIEIPVSYRRRQGRSKISGTLRGVVGAGWKILDTIRVERRDDRRARRSPRLIVFSRWPIAGQAKTRLIPALGPQGAADLQRRMTSHTLRVARQWAEESSGVVEVRFTGGLPHQMIETFGVDAHYIEQGPGDLGQRLCRALDHALQGGAPAVLCIGSDCPAIEPALLSESIDRLRRCEVVLGPARDGGYYLVGLKRSQPGIFEAIEWGTSRVLEQTRDRIRAAGLRSSELMTLEDVDEPRDLPVWESVCVQNPTPPQPWLSVIIPTLDEEQQVGSAVDSARQAAGVEVIVADGGSTDQTTAAASDHGAITLTSPPGRGVQLNAGAAAARAPWLLFLHADTRLPFGYDHHVRRVLGSQRFVAGAFRMAFDQKGLSLGLIEWGANLRARRRAMPYGDQAIFLRRETFERLGGFPPVPRMEDYALITRLRQVGRIVVAPAPAVTSARTYLRHGPWRTVLLHQHMILMWRRQHRRLARHAHA